MELTKKQLELCSEILDILYSERPISRIDISNKTGITPATVSFLTGKLIEKNLLCELGEEYNKKNKVGRRKVLLDIASDYCYYIGSEITELFYSFVLTDNLGNLITQKIYYLEDKKSNITSNLFIKQLLHFYESLNKPISAIGISLPGHYNNSSKIFTNNLFWNNFDLNKITNSFNIPVYFSNNVNCMALAERFFHNKENCNFIFFHISRGIHCSYIYEGDFFSKNNYLIGEVGHTVVNPEGPLCECGKKGCLQTYASETWLLKYAKSLYENSSSTFLHELVNSNSDVSMKTIINAYNLADNSVIKLINTAIKYIALTINNLNMILDFSKIYIHGEIFNNEKISNLLLQSLNIEPKLLVFPKKEETVIKPFKKSDGALGACALCIYRDLLAKTI